MKLDLHVHSGHSFDSNTDIKAVISHARQAGMNAIAICDHDSFSSYNLARKFAGDLVIIPSMEITCRGGTHVIGLFIEQEIISRDIFEVIDEIHEHNGLVMIPHLFRVGTGLVYNREKQKHFSGDDMARILAGVDLVEAVNFRCSADDNFNAEKFLSYYPDLPRVAGSDAHHAGEIGKAYVELDTVKSDSLEDIKKALLTSPRMIRYEVYSDTVAPEQSITVIKGRKESLIVRTKNFVPNLIGKSLKAFYRKSASVLTGGRKEETKKKIDQNMHAKR